ncbi:hypothetical protein PHYBOEH_005559 [Phytophthora boehmeriae]|uniref:Uncharacterized protein n=1 Tax=Phytophthora boehmeriae TaxID=109152 RepID=A0A8T1WLI5_9STRA|nr:hypothetical protein PHYBOEH_005559 [Phytophthora boehmeriae]
MPILQNVYTRLDILDLVDGQFAKTTSIYLLGEASACAKSTADVALRNKKLVAAIGAKAVRTLTSGDASQVTGGDDWDELNELDFEELLNTDEPAPVVTPTNKSTKQVAVKDSISNLVLYTKDKITDVAEKIALATGIDPYKQYLWLPNAKRSLDGDEISLMSHWANAINTVDEYPVDAHYKVDRSAQPYIESFASDSAIVITCISLDSIISSKTKMQMIARSDAESFGLIYTNIIQRFFPSLSYAMFAQYLADESQLRIKFEDLEFDREATKEKLAQLSKLIPELNKQKRVTIESTECLSTITTGMILASKYANQVPRVNTMKLFQDIDIITLTDVAMIDLYRLDNEQRPIRIRKEPQRDQYRLAKDDMLMSSGLYTRKSLVYLRAMVVTLLPKDEYETIMIVVDQFGTLWIKTQPSQMHAFSKSAFLKFITPTVDAIIREFNSHDSAFVSHERFMTLCGSSSCLYNIVSSSSKITFKFPVNYQKLLDLVSDKFLATGLMTPFVVDWSKRKHAVTYFELRYGVTRSAESGNKHKVVEFKNARGVAMISLSNLDMPESDLYVDFIGRIVIGNSKQLKAQEDSQEQLTAIDPILYRPRVTSDMYSRICQKRFQPIVTTAAEPGAVKYHNFTFNKPEYYKCRSKHAPILGFIQNKHEKGFCLPCCRKTLPAVDIKDACIAQTDESKTQQATSSTYKIEYPIHEVANSKIMHRRVILPAYVGHLFGAPGLVANGSILLTHAAVQDGMNPNTKSFLQTAIMISAIQSATGKPLYNSYRELIIDIVAMVKHPRLQIAIMNNKMISERYTTPQALVHVIEDQFLKMTILDIHNRLSDIEWNDLIVYLANCMGINVLLLSDDRSAFENIRLTNLFDINVEQPVSVFLRRINLEWSIANQNTRALYLPVTTSKFKVQYKSALLIERLNIGKALARIKRVTSGPILNLLAKQFTVERIEAVVKQSRQYTLVNDLSSQKIAVLRIGKLQLVMTFTTMATTVHPEPIDVKPTATIANMLVFITDYNIHYADATPSIQSKLASYKTYLQASLKMSSLYEFILIDALLLKVSQFIICDELVIGAVVSLVEVNRVVATELMFFKPVSVAVATAEIDKSKRELATLRSRVNAKALLCFPLANDTSFVTWSVNPLTVRAPEQCPADNMNPAFDAGVYSNEIYHLLVRDIVQAWSSERSSELDAFMVKEMQKMGPPVIVQTKIDRLIEKVCTEYDTYDPLVVRATVNELFERINTTARTNADAVSQFKSDAAFAGFELKNVYRMSRKQVKTKLESIMRTITVKTNTYPSFNLDISVGDQRKTFYDNGKLMIHASLRADLIDTMLSDLLNPFRRDYIINSQLTEAVLSDIRLHTSELIYIQNVAYK